MQVPVTLYAEMTPNPATMKFVSNRYMVVDGQVYEYGLEDDTENSPMAAKLLNFPFISKVFIASNFVAITKTDIIEWEDVIHQLRDFLGEYLNNNGVVVKVSALEMDQKEEKQETVTTPKRTDLEGIDATNWDNSVDLYGGGGYVGTTTDLTKFYHHLFNNNIFESPETLKLMLSSNGIKGQGKTAEAYKMGLWEVATPNGSGFMHNGFWGSAVIHFPKYNATIGLYHIDGFNNEVMKNAFMEIVKRTDKK